MPKTQSFQSSKWAFNHIYEFLAYVLALNLTF